MYHSGAATLGVQGGRPPHHFFLDKLWGPLSVHNGPIGIVLGKICKWYRFTSLDYANKYLIFVISVAPFMAFMHRNCSFCSIGAHCCIKTLRFCNSRGPIFANKYLIFVISRGPFTQTYLLILLGLILVHDFRSVLPLLKVEKENIMVSHAKKCVFRYGMPFFISYLYC